MAVLPQSEMSLHQKKNLKASNLTHLNLQPERVGLWDQISSIDPDLIILLGDNMYADTRKGIGQFVAATPTDIKNKYNKLNEDKIFTSMVEKVGGWNNIAATFDDHDYGINNGNKNYPYKLQSQQLFWDFINVPTESPTRRQKGVYSSKEFSINLNNLISNKTITAKFPTIMTKSTYIINDIADEGTAMGNETKQRNQKPLNEFRYKVIMLDMRSNSGEEVESSSMSNKEKSSLDNELLGDEQWLWLEKEINSDVDLIIIGSSIQLLPTDKLTEESWGANPRARTRMISLILASKCPNVLVLSGDVHYAEISKVKCSWMETQNSGIDFDNYTDDSSGIRDNSSRSTDSSKSDADDSVHKNDILWELTSSGLTHTFSKSSPLLSKINSNDDSESAILTDVIARNVMMDTKDLFPSLKGFIYNLYQATFPSHYREQRYADHYQGINFGVLDINIESMKSAVGHEDVVMSVTFRVMNHYGKAMITKNILLKPRNSVKVSEKGKVIRHNLVCEPFWGPVPPWRMHLTYAMVALPILAIILPFIFIFLYFILYLIKIVYTFHSIGSSPNEKRKRIIAFPQ